MAPASRTLLLVLFYGAILLGVAGLAFVLLQERGDGRPDGSADSEGFDEAPASRDPEPPRPSDPSPAHLPVAPAATTNASGWTVNGTGPTVVCPDEDAPCSVRMAPTCCAVRHVAERPLDWTLEGPAPVNLTFRFRGPPSPATRTPSCAS